MERSIVELYKFYFIAGIETFLILHLFILQKYQQSSCKAFRYDGVSLSLASVLFSECQSLLIFLPVATSCDRDNKIVVNLSYIYPIYCCFSRTSSSLSSSILVKLALLLHKFSTLSSIKSIKKGF